VVTDSPETHYTRSADGTNLAYQVCGNGPLDLVFVHGTAIPTDLLSEDPGFVRLRKRLGMFSRSVWFDRRGRGASEGDSRDSQVGEIVDADLIAVLDAVGIGQSAMVGAGISASDLIRFSLTHPERVSALVLVNSFAYYIREDDYPWGVPFESLDNLTIAVKDNWVTGAAVEIVAPSRMADERFRAWYARSTRFGAGPDEIADIIRAGMQDDVRQLLPSISVPTLVLHHEGNRYIHLGAGRYLAEHIPGARFVVLPGDDNLFFVGDTDALADEIEDFLTGFRSGAEGEVVMAAVLFTDIVASTEQQVRVGPREWSRLTDRHDAIVRAALARYRGHEVKTTGDGFLATFDATGRALRCAADILAGAEDIGLDLRVGVHTGEVEVRGDDIAGLAVTIAKRVCDLARPSQVLVSEIVRGHMVGSGIQFYDQGEHELKGVPGNWRLYAVSG
jgi:class 3 adenylate cyclase/pimeloyl-ACP methyl ester carboxylesterase